MTATSPTLGEPLRSAVGATKYAECIPPAWFKVSLSTIYSYRGRAFAKRMYLEEPHLLFHFALANLSLLCGDPGITTQHIRSMMRAKYGIH